MSGQAQLLRRAAALMRADAEDACGPYGDRDADPVAQSHSWEALIDNYLGGEMGQHHAALTPAVLLVLAEWVEDEAVRIDDTPYRVDSDWVERNYRAPLAVARAYLNDVA